MATARQQLLERELRRALQEFGAGASTDFLIATTSERTQADPREIIDAVEVVNRRESSDEGAGHDVAALVQALGKSVTAIWGKLPQELQRELFEHAVSGQEEATRERLAVFLHAMHFRTTDALKARAMPEPDSLGG
jgi:hypothetical protein